MVLQLDVGKIKFQWQGNYDAATDYYRDDVVYHDGSAWVCVKANDPITGLPVAITGVTPATSATASWNKMAQGSDLGALTGLSSGDIIYYDGSDFQRLAAGTQGQVLKMGASAPEWGNSSGLVNIEGTTDNVTTGMNYSAATVYAIPGISYTYTTVESNSEFLFYIRSQVDDASSTSFGADIGLRYSIGAGTSNWVYIHWPDQHTQYHSGSSDTYLQLHKTFFVDDLAQPAGTVIEFEPLMESHNDSFRFFHGGNNGSPKRGAEFIIQEYKP